MRILPFLFIFVFTSVNVAWAESAVTCHCFQDREYDPQRAGAADPYFLATTQNALMAELFSISKKELVRAKMGGADGDSLWVGYYLAQQSGAPFVEIDQLFSKGAGWSAVIRQLKIDPERLPPRFVAALGNQETLAMIVVDEQLLEHLDVEPLQLQRLRGLGADNHQTVMAVFLGQASLLEPAALFVKVASGQASWGQLLAGQGLFNGSEIEDKWRQVLESKE